MDENLITIRISKRNLILICIMFFIVIAVFVSSFVLNKLNQSIEVPNVIGQSKVEAEKTFESLGVKVQWNDSFSGDVIDNSVVLGQSPVVGESIRKTTPVTLIISKGKQ